MKRKEKASSALSTYLGMPAFWRVQHPDWKVTVVRTSLERLGYQMIYPYLSVFIVALGADKTQLGLMTSLGMILAGIISPYVGKIIDQDGPRRAYLTGIALLVLAYLTYALSPTWPVAALAMMIYYLGQGTGIHSCSAICGNCLKNCDRAKGMMLCESVAAGLLGMIGPMISAGILLYIMGVEGDVQSAGDIRPLFFLAAAISLSSFFVVFFKLSKSEGLAKGDKSMNVLRDAREFLSGNPITKKWLIISAINGLPAAMVLPFCQVYAEEVKGASVAVLAAMVMAAAFTSVVFGYPIGVLCDKIGRKKTQYLTVSLLSVSNLLLVLAPSPAVLVLSGVFLGFYYIGGPLSSAMARELVSQDKMGRWIGLTRLTNNLFGALMATVAGIIYDRVGPEYVFLINVGLDMLVRLPLLSTMPETLHESKEAAS